MSRIKQKLNSNRGASMIMAMVFLMFCLLIGGSVLAMATANGSRIENMAADQQEYYSQRSAVLMIADMLTGKNGKELQVMITDTTVEQDGAESVLSITVSSPSLPATVPLLQKVLLEVVVNSCRQTGATVRYPDFNWIQGANPTFAPASDTIVINDGIAKEPLNVNYKIHTPNTEGKKDYTLSIDFGQNTSHIVLEMDGFVSTGDSTTVTVEGITTTTTTTVIRWSLPDVQKVQMTMEQDMGGN